jgi:hypothetical protein
VADLIAPARELGGGKIRPVVLHLGACLAFRGWAVGPASFNIT